MKIYTPERTDSLRHMARAALWLTLIVTVLALSGCVALCVTARTLTYFRNACLAIAVWTIGGWAAILAIKLAYLPAVHEYRHAESLMKCPVTELTGTVLSKGALFRIPRSIEVVRVRVQAEDGEHTLNVLSRAAGSIPEAGRAAVFNVARGYITEVRDEQA